MTSTFTIFKSRKTILFIFLSGIFISNAITAEIIGVKLFSFEAMLALKPAQIDIFGLYKLDFNLTAGALIWPVVFITSDIINEYFGKEGVKRISYLTAFLISYVFVILWLATCLPPADFWVNINKKDILGNNFNINSAYATIFRQGLGIIIGSIVAFLIGQMIDAYIFQKIRLLTGKKAIWLRATGSTLISQLIDSFVVLYIAFYVFGGNAKWELSRIFAIGMINYIYKFIVAIILTPVLYLAHSIIDNYLGNETDELDTTI